MNFKREKNRDPGNDSLRSLSISSRIMHQYLEKKISKALIIRLPYSPVQSHSYCNSHSIRCIHLKILLGACGQGGCQRGVGSGMSQGSAPSLARVATRGVSCCRKKDRVTYSFHKARGSRGGNLPLRQFVHCLLWSNVTMCYPLLIADYKVRVWS